VEIGCWCSTFSSVGSALSAFPEEEFGLAGQSAVLLGEPIDLGLQRLALSV
jgi:hypothetical protein